MEQLLPDPAAFWEVKLKTPCYFGYSNKAHDGYLGDSVIGEWCNLGAGSSNSNMKNSGGEVKYWNAIKKNLCTGRTEIRTADGRLFQVSDQYIF